MTCSTVISRSSYISFIFSLFFFFFQAEDGIRDRTVTGVQTCALPIYIEQPVGLCVAGGHEHEPDLDRLLDVAVARHRLPDGGGEGKGGIRHEARPVREDRKSVV